MVRVRKSVAVARPLHDVFAFLADASKEPLWRSSVSAMVRDGGPSRGVGSRYRMTGSYEGKTGEAVMTCTEYVPDERITYSGGEGPVSANFTYQTREDGGATRVSMTIKVDIKGAAGMFAGMAEKMLDKMAEADMRGLKRYLEKA